MEAVASGMAVVSLAIQLIHTVATIKTFIRNVKDSQKELERLVELLERLGGLLEDIRDLLKRQSSMAEYLPMPSTAIFTNLQSCEKTLQPLNELVEKLRTSSSLVGTGVARLKSGLKLSMKTKDIADMEVRIEREINFLHACLGANLNAISLQAFLALLEGQNTIKALQQSLAAYSHSNQESTVTTMAESTITSCRSGAICYEGNGNGSNVVSTRVSVQTTMIRSFVNRFGIYRRKKIGRMLISSKSRNRLDGQVLWEDDETTLVSGLLSYGFTWTQHQTYGKLLPSLSVFPVVKDHGLELEKIIRLGDTTKFQQLISSGKVHPFTRDEYGYSLLHVAAFYHSTDICRLLKIYGVKTDVTSSGYAECDLAMDLPAKETAENKIATLRLFFSDDELLSEDDVSFQAQLQQVAMEDENAVIEWIVQQCARLLPFENYMEAQKAILTGKWRRVCKTFRQNPLDGFSLQHPEQLFPDKFMEHAEQHGCPLLQYLFHYSQHASESFILGDILIQWLIASGLDVEASMKVFLKDPGDWGYIWDDWGYLGDDWGYIWDNCRFVFESNGEGVWRLGYEWLDNPGAPGYHIVSEYPQWRFMSRSFIHYRWDKEACIKSNWPFIICPDDQKESRAARFARRMAKKERARSGQKVKRSKMPGTWVW